MQLHGLIARLTARVAVLEAAAGITPPTPEAHPGAAVATVHRPPVFMVPPEPTGARVAPVALVTPENTDKKPKPKN